MKKTYLVLILSFLFLGFIQNDDEQIPGVENIKSTNLLKTVEFLSSPELKGRLGGSEGYYTAADYMRNEFKRLGLKPMGDDGFYQTFNVEYNEIISAKFSLTENGVVKKTYSLGKDYVCRSFSGSGNFSGEVVFCGYGFTDEKFDEYKNVDVKDKAVLIFKQTPDWKIDDGKWNQSLRYRAAIAYSKGAKAVIFISRPNDKNPQKPIGSTMDGEGEQIIDLPMIHIDLSLAEDLFEKSEKQISELQKEIDETKTPKSVLLKSNVTIDVRCNYEKNRKTMNIAGLLEGNDEKLKNEFLIIGAHLDHVGSQAGEIYFPGANDNASGSASLLEIARTFVNSKIKPKRSILFIFFSNEESGLNGSNYYCEHPLIPLEKTIAMFNNDCVGSGDSIQVGCGESFPELWKIAKDLDMKNSKSMISRTWKTGGADAEAFYLKGIPTLYFVSYFSYKHLHLPSDKVETLNPVLFENLCKLAYMTAYTKVNE